MKTRANGFTLALVTNPRNHNLKYAANMAASIRPTRIMNPIAT
jgi:hypothetical protein